MKSTKTVKFSVLEKFPLYGILQYKHTHTHTHTHTFMHRHKHTYRQTDRHTNKQTNKHTYKHAHTQTHVHAPAANITPAILNHVNAYINCMITPISPWLHCTPY